MRNQFDKINKLGRYEFIRPLGRGGSGVVYLALDTQLNREVAIKCFTNTSSNEHLIKLRHEAELLAKLNHQNVVQVHDVVTGDEVMGLVMEYVDGTTLSAKLKEPLVEKTLALDWLIQVADGLSMAHEAGIIHCDLKAENILLNFEGKVKIADFGIAKARSREQRTDDAAAASAPSGSYLSVSPEQAQGKTVDFRTDIFSFGILIYQLLTGRHPFGKMRDHRQTAQRIVNERFEFSAVDAHILEPKLLSLISNTLEKSPDKRPANINQVARTLRQIKSEIETSSASSNASPNNTTMLFKPIKKTGYLPPKLVAWLSVFFVLAAFATAVTKYWPKATADILYVALLEPTIEVVDEFDPSHKDQISATVKASLQEAVLNISFLNLINDSNAEQFAGDIAKFAQAVAADVVLQPQLQCSIVKCEISLQKFSGKQWSVSKLRSWPVLAASLSDIRSTALIELPELFSIESIDAASMAIDEDVYRRYLAAYQAITDGGEISDQYLNQLEKIRFDAPSLISLYQLYTSSSLKLFESRGDERTLARLDQFLALAPATIRNIPAFKKLEFDRLLISGEQVELQSLIDEIASLSLDRVLVNDLTARLAYESGDYEAAVLLERKNSILRPSFARHYNLAATEFFLGNLELAKASAEKVLAIVPNDVDTQNLLATIELSQGEVDGAINIYQTLVKKNPSDSFVLTNLGLSLMLKGEYQQAVSYLASAAKLNPSDSLFKLNLADCYNLLGMQELANANYQDVIVSTSQPVDASAYYQRAQAQVHMGEHNQAIKTLQRAEQSFERTAELAYAAAIVHTLAGNHSAAIVEVENAVQLGIGPIWFNLPWFNSFCGDAMFGAIVNDISNLACDNN